MNCPLGEEVVGGAKNEGSLMDVLWLNGMGNINYHSLGIDAEYYPLHDADVGISEPKIGNQGDYIAHSGYLPNRDSDYSDDDEDDS